jgi:adenylate kinase
MILLLFGPPGCGKGTQAAILAEYLRIPAISTGEMFRAECTAGTGLGKAAAAILACGGLVGDDLVNRIVASRIARPDCAGGFLLDGYPRTVPQAIFFSEQVANRGWPSPTVIHLDVARDVLVARLAARRQCPRCGRVYSLLFQLPRVAGRCDDDSSELVTRADDQEPVIRQRLRAYDVMSGPVLKWYPPSVVQTVDGSRPAPAVAAALEALIRELCLAPTVSRRA